LFARFLDRLHATPDGDGSLLDHALIVYGSGMGNGNVHSPEQLPFITVGGDGGRVRGNRHIVVPPSTPNANALLSVVQHFGVPVDTFGVSTGRIDL